MAILGRMFRLPVKLCLQFYPFDLGYPLSKTQSHFYYG